jgi:hypothetical protein
VTDQLLFQKLLGIKKVNCSSCASAATVVKITFVKKDAPLAQKIMEVIKGGTIVYPKD